MPTASQLYTEHLSYCSDDGHLYDLLPIPFTEEAVRYVAARIRRAQDILERRIAIENASYYTPSPVAEMDELDFIHAVLDEADCDLHLDVNNVYVNSVNHRYDPLEFIRALPTERIVYLHIAGHYNEADDLLVDTHGADVIDPVWALLDADLPHPRRRADAAGARLQHSAAGRTGARSRTDRAHAGRPSRPMKNRRRFLSSSATSTPSPRTSAIPRRSRARRASKRGA